MPFKRSNAMIVKGNLLDSDEKVKKVPYCRFDTLPVKISDKVMRYEK